MAEKVLGVENLRLKFPGAPALLFKDLTLSISEGEKVLFLGPSGCGKSTLLQVLSGIIPHSVDVPVKADEIELSASWGYVFQDPDTQFCMPFVDEEVAFVLENLGVPRAQMLPRIHELLELVGLSFEDAHVPIQSLSQGMKQRLALASVLALEPKVLLLDEPTALLDPAGTVQIWETIKRLTSDKTVIIVEHKINEIVDYVDRVVLFGPEGRILADGPAEQIFQEHKPELIRFGIWYPEVWEDYVRQLVPAQGVDSAITNAAVMKLDDFKAYRGATCKIHVPVPTTIGTQEWIAITGENGAGKSTLLLAMMQLLKTTGLYELKGQEIDRVRASVAQELAYVFQNPEFQFVTQSVFEEIAYSLKLLNTPKEQVESKVQGLLASFELQGREEQHPYQLSIGQKRRLSVASALVREQSILLLDEPTFGQDAKNTFAMLEQLERLRKAGTTILMITHDEEIVRYFATRVWEIERGVLVRDEFKKQELYRPFDSDGTGHGSLLEDNQAVKDEHGCQRAQADQSKRAKQREEEAVWL